MKLSVCIPVYNVSAYIERCAHSLFAQTYSDIEYIFVDDCTPDDSIAVVERVLEGYPQRRGQVRILRHSGNRGLVAARRTAIQAATGDLITFCDSDDWVDIDLYEKMISRLVMMNADVVLCSTRRYVGGRILEMRCPPGLCICGQEALRRMDELPALNAMMTKIFLRKRIDLNEIEYPEGLSIAEDYCLTVQALARCTRLVTMSDAFYDYCVNENSMTRSGDVRRLIKHHIWVYEILTHRVPNLEARVPCRNLLRPVLFWGVCHGLLTAGEYWQWRKAYQELGGCWDWSDMSLWGQRMMKLADCSFVVSQLVAPLIRRRIHDYL